MRVLFFYYLLLFSFCSYTQNSLTAIYSSSIPTNYSETVFGYDNMCNGPSTTVSITLPPGLAYNVSNVKINYNMEALYPGWKSDQYSSVKFQNTNLTETIEANGIGNQAGIQYYDRNITLANGTYPGGTTLIFSLRARRSYEGTPGCNIITNMVLPYTFKVTVEFSDEITYGQLGIGLMYPTKGKLEVYGVGHNGRNTAAFGSEGAGITLQRNPPSIGLNLYDNNGNYEPLLSSGNHSLIDFSISGALSFGFRQNSNLPFNYTTIQNNGNVDIGLPNTYLTSLFLENVEIKGSSFSSKFWENKSYINGGKFGSKVYINDIPFGKILIGGNVDIGDMGPHYQNISLTLFGKVAFTKRDEHNVCTSSLFFVGNTSYVNVVRTGCGSSNTPLQLTAGNVEGQILIIQIEGNNDFTIFDTGNLDLQGNIQLGGGDILMLIWNQSIFKWTQLSYSNN